MILSPRLPSYSRILDPTLSVVTFDEAIQSTDGQVRWQPGATATPHTYGWAAPSNGYFATTTPIAIKTSNGVGTGDFTLVLRAVFAAGSTGWVRPFSIGTTSGGWDDGYLLLSEYYGAVSASLKDGYSQLTISTTGWANLATKRPEQVVVRRGNGQVAVHTRFSSSAASASAHNLYKPANSNYTQVYNDNGTMPVVSYFGWFDRAVSDGELAEILRNGVSKYVHSQPRKIWAQLSEAVAGGTTITPSTGNLVATGYSPALTATAHRQISPSTGHLTVSGYTPETLQPHTVSPILGHITVTGHTPEIQQGLATILAPSTGQVFLVGHAPVITQTAATVLFPATGRITFTGYAPSIFQDSGDQVVTPGTGSVLVSGNISVIFQASPIVGFSVISTGGGGGGKRWLKESGINDKIDAVIEEYAQKTVKTKEDLKVVPEEKKEVAIEKVVGKASETISFEAFMELTARVQALEQQFNQEFLRARREAKIWKALAEGDL